MNVAPTQAGARSIRSVLCTLPFGPEQIEQIRAAFEPAEFIHCQSSDAAAIAAALDDVDVAVIAGDLDDRYVAAPNLKWVHCDHSGLTKSARPDVFAKGLIVTGAAGRSASALAQHGFYFALALTFDAPGLLADQARHVWRGNPDYGKKVGLAGKTLGIVGLGNTGREMAALGKAFQMRVVAYTRSVQQKPANVDELLCAEREDQLDTLIDAADVIMLATQLSDDTYHMFGAAQLKRMRKSAFIINMARGPVIDEAALVSALKAGEIAGAGLDVFTQEPLPKDDPIWDAPNVIITPHQTPVQPDRTQRSIVMIVANAERYRAGQPLLNALSQRDIFTPRT